MVELLKIDLGLLLMIDLIGIGFLLLFVLILLQELVDHVYR